LVWRGDCNKRLELIAWKSGMRKAMPADLVPLGRNTDLVHRCRICPKALSHLAFLLLITCPTDRPRFNGFNGLGRSVGCGYGASSC
jgi:hypothetical protein